MLKSKVQKNRGVVIKNKEVVFKAGVSDVDIKGIFKPGIH